MTGTMLPQPQAPGALAGLGLGVGNQISPSVVNSYRISAVAERLASHVQPGHQSDAVEFFNLCLSLSRGIDYAVANNEIPGKAQDLPILLKQICQRKNDVFLHAAIMVLMISVKNACKMGWFQKKEAEELFTIATEIGKSYCNMGDVNAGPNYSHSMISAIMERFYPKMKMGQILASLEAKPGYGAFAVDFHISKNTARSLQDKIWLLVAQTDNIETSTCIISPQQVNFLLNGKGVDRRTNVLMDTGPQMPTNVNHMLKYGTNLLQAVGQFNGHYVILVAFMSFTSLPENPILQDYVQPAVSLDESDSDIIEGPSQISLNCPISFTRIKTPVKGHSCKHFQCFDFNNYIDINSRRPSWRCPHCNQYVCYADIRLDRNMVEVLKAVGENVVEVVIHADGSWKAVLENDHNEDKMQNKAQTSENEKTEPQESSSSPCALPDVLDLTNDDVQMVITDTCETEDRKPLWADLQSQSVTPNSTSLGMNSTGVNQNVAAQVEDDFWTGVYFTNNVLTDAISPAFNREAGGHQTLNMQNQFSAPNNCQLQQFNCLNSAVNEYGRSSSIPRHLNRTPVAIQALPAQSQSLGPQQRSRTNLNSLISNSSSVTHVPLSNPASAILSDTERQQHFSRPATSLPQVSGITSALQHNSATQGRAPQIVNATRPSQLPNPYRTSGLLTEFRNQHLQQALGPRTTQPISQPVSTVRSSNSQRSHIQQGSSQAGVGQAVGAATITQQARVIAPAQVPRQSQPIPVQNQTSRVAPSVTGDSFRGLAGDQRGNVGGTTQSVSRPDDLYNMQTEQNWRPTGRMRGSLSGRQFSDAVRQLIIEPTQPVPSARPQGPQPVRPNSVTPKLLALPTQPVQSARPQGPQPVRPNSVSPQLQALLANNRNVQNNPQTHISR